MRQFIIFLLFYFTSTLVNAQIDEKVFYVDETNDYRLLIDKTTKVHKQKLADSRVETFVFTKDNQFKFTVTISRSKAKNMTNDSLSTPNYEQAYVNNCGCEVLSIKQSGFTNVNSLQFKIKRVEKGKTLLGYTDSFVVNNVLFNIVFMTLENTFPLYQKEYTGIMNTMIINK